MLEDEKRRVLIVDDEVDITLVLKKGLERAGYSVTTFNDPEKALSHFKENYYNLSILDIKMPKMNGFELYKALVKKDSELKACFMTAFEIYREEFKKVFPSYQIHCFIKKPISIKDLVGIVNSELKGSIVGQAK